MQLADREPSTGGRDSGMTLAPPRDTPPGSTIRSGLSIYLIATGLAAFVFLRFPCYRYFPDGLDYAWVLETATKPAVHPHHPLFPLIPQVLFWLVGGEASSVSGLGMILVWAMVFGVLAVWLFATMLRALHVRPVTALFCLAVFAFSAGVWFFCATPNQYSTALVFHLIALTAILTWNPSDTDRHPTVKLLGVSALIGIAALAHAVNLLLLCPLIYRILASHESRSQRASAAATASATSVVVYLGLTILAGLILLGLKTPSDFLDWQKSYVTHGQYWARNPLDSIERSFQGAVELHLAHSFHSEGIFGTWTSPPEKLTGFPLWLARACQAYALLFLLALSIRAFVSWLRAPTRPPWQTTALVSFAAFFAFTLVFAPESTNYRIFYLPAFLLFVTPTIDSYSRPRTPFLRTSWPLLLFLLVLFLTNFTLKFLPESDPERNPYLSEAGLLAAYLGPGDLAVFSGAEEDYLRARYLRYFSRADAVILPDLIDAIRHRPDDLANDYISRNASGHFIAIHEDALYSLDDIAWINDFYRTDISAGEIAAFFFSRFEIAATVQINEKDYIFIVPLEPITPGGAAPIEGLPSDNQAD